MRLNPQSLEKAGWKWNQEGRDASSLLAIAVFRDSQGNNMFKESNL